MSDVTIKTYPDSTSPTPATNATIMGAVNASAPASFLKDK